jgi:trehalose-phosphatase
MCQPFFDTTHDVGERIQQASHLLLCLDYDGTLSRFAVNPVGATLSTQMDRVLRVLAQEESVSLAIISGRDRLDLQSRVAIPGIFYAGNHGLEISGPGRVFIEPTAATYSESLQQLATDLGNRLQTIEGALVEFKGLTIAVHFRQVASERLEDVRHQVHGALANAAHPFVLSTGEKVYEIRPRVYWNKGTAVKWIREQLAKPETLCIYVGDDVTDEDAFAALPNDITIKVGDAPESAAHYRLSGPTEVRKFLEWVEELIKARKEGHASHRPADTGPHIVQAK